MKFIVAWLAFFFIPYSYSQTTNTLQPQNAQTLDAKNGINKFKLSSFLEIHKANLKELSDSSSASIKWYAYIGTDVPKVFEYKVKQITLGYYKNKLYKIFVSFDGNQTIQTDDVKSKLELLFGTGKYRENYLADRHHDWSYTWESTKVYLCFDKLNDKEIYIWTFSKVIEKQIIFDEL
jgi:hypothetical protein